MNKEIEMKVVTNITKSNKYYALADLCSYNRPGVYIGISGEMFHLDYNEERELVKELGRVFRKAWKDCKSK